MQIREASLAKYTILSIKDWADFQVALRTSIRSNSPPLRDSVPLDFPSRCYKCDHARSVWSKTLENTGHVGCSLGVDHLKNEDSDMIYHMAEEAELFGTGWVKLRAAPFDRAYRYGAGIITNNIFITKRVKRCSKFLLKE